MANRRVRKHRNIGHFRASLHLVILLQIPMAPFMRFRPNPCKPRR